MGKRGPQPQSAELKKLRGNPGKRAIKEVPTAPAGYPKCPADLVADVGKEWDRYGKVLSSLGILRETDWPMYDALWRTWAKYKVLADRSAKLDELTDALEPNDDAKLIAQILRLVSKIEPLELQYLGALVKLLDHFGMAPSSRGSISVEPPKEESEFEKFLAKQAK